MKLLFGGIIKFLLGFILVGLLIFIPAGTINYFNGLLFIGILFIPMFIGGLILFFTNKKLLESRLNNKEKESTQKVVIGISGLMFIIGFIVAGLNYRFNWFLLPNIISIVASIIFIIFYILYAEVLKENTYLSRTVEVVDNQKVIDTGLYGIVRHPMYIVTIMMFLMIPLILGDIFSLFIFLIYPILIIVRINNEEKILEKELKGYTEYKKKIKYRLIPFIY